MVVLSYYLNIFLVLVSIISHILTNIPILINNISQSTVSSPSFGQITGTTYTSLSDNSVLTSNTTLYCVTENKDTPQVKWSYVDLDGIRSDLTSTTDANTGVSNIQVFTTEPGYYTCEVTENGGISKMYTVGILNTELYTGKLIDFNYHYSTTKLLTTPRIPVCTYIVYITLFNKDLAVEVY